MKFISINFNEGGTYYWIPFSLAINYMNLKFFLLVVYPCPVYVLKPHKIDKKHWIIEWKELFTIAIQKKS